MLARYVTLWVYNVVLSYVQNNEDAEEVIQDTLLATINGIGSFKNESSIKTWVYSIALNKSKDYLKYKGRQKRSAYVVSLDSENNYENENIKDSGFNHPGILLESKEQMEILFTAINNLPEHQKEAIILSKLDGLSVKEVAAVMNTTAKAVESLLSRARKNLKNYLSTEGILIYKKIKHE